MKTVHDLLARRRWVFSAATLAVLAVLVPAAASAHPLGNFTINRYDGLRVAPDAVTIDHVLDMAEIPTFSERSSMDADGNGAVSLAEMASYEADRCEATRADLTATVDGQPLPLETVARGLTFPQGQGALTLRLVCTYRGTLATPLTTAAAFSFADVSFADRRGWREVTVQGDRTTIVGSDAPTATVSQRLTSYPADLLAIPSAQTTATWTVTPGGPALAPLQVPDAEPVNSGQGTSAIASVPDTQNVAPPPAAAVPNGISDLGANVTALFQASDLTPWVLAVSLLVAAGLGAVHALSPGHGKTVMAAYLVGSRGSARQALGLGLVVTISHTVGVLALGLLSLSFSTVIPPDRLYPILGVASGAIVVGIGSWLIWQRVHDLRTSRATARAERAHAAAHSQGLDHPHDHELNEAHSYGGDHNRGDRSRGDRSDDRGHEADEGWHSHGGARHTHLPPKGTTVSTRGLIALGLAGGMVPSVSALILLLGSLSAGRPAYGIVLTVAFGIGMAVVLVGIGLGLVYARGFVERFSSGGRSFGVIRWLPTATAVVVLGAGVLMTVQGLALVR